MANFLKIRGVLVVIGLLLFLDGSAQDLLSNNWYFGNAGRGIRFNRTDNTPTLVTGAVLTTGGSAVATSPVTGNVLFYTDGARVFNISNAQMSNGFGLSANTTSNQPVAVSPIPGQSNQYLIFTNSASYTGGGTISVSTVDMTVTGGEPFPTPPLGNVTTKNVATGLTGRSEAMITVPHDNGVDFWLISHENGTDNYTSTLIEAGPVFTHNTFTNVTSLPISAANFSYHEASGKIAVSPQTADDNVVILDFDNATGAITFDQFVFNSSVSSTNTQATFDTEWSLSGRFLYISRHGQPGIAANVLQFDMNFPSASLASVLPAPVNRSYGLQIAPDSSIYHLYETGGIFHVARLTDIDSVATDVIYTPDAFGPINFGGRQFSSFSPWSMLDLTVTFTAAATCSTTDYFANSPISFYPTVSPGADSLVWDFGDGATSSQWSPIHTYQITGAVNVEVIAYLNGDTSRFDLDLTLDPFDLELSLVPDTTACRCEFPAPVGTACNNGPFEVTVEAQGGSSPTFLWSNGDTGATLTPDSAGYYYVVATDGGCSAYAAVNIREYGATDQRANIWYFGNNAGIDFNTPPGRRSIPGPVNTLEGVSVISDRNGQVIFSTDGVTVYDRNDLPVATNIGGEQDATQSALIMPVQGDETLYYIFTTQAVHGTYTYELRYSLYDIKLNGGNGGLAETNQLLFSRSTERITGDAGWLIAHEYGNNSFRAYPVGPNGIGNPIISSVGSDHLITDQFNGRGYMELGQGQIAVALSSFTIPSNVVEFFDFSSTTGAVSNFRSINLNSTTQQVYGIEFVGNKFFATLRGATSALREIYFDFQGNPVLIPPGPVVPPATELGAIQRGPDGQIYVAVNNQQFLGTIQVNADTLLVSTFTLNGFPLTTGRSTLGLPNFIQNVGNAPSAPGMTISGFCEGSPTIFVGSGTDPIDEFRWSFGDGFFADSASVEHTYPITGVPTNYLVRLDITNRCIRPDTISRMRIITIYPPPANPTFLLPGVPQAVLCTGSLTLEAEPAPGTTGYTYLWSTGETTRSIVVTRESIVNVTITNPQGCTSSGSRLVADNRPQVNLGPDQTICENTPIAPLNAQNSGANYQWFVSAITNGPAMPNGNTAQTQTVNTGVIGNYEYKVQVLDPITLCRVRDSLVFTINESPEFLANVTPPAVCGANGQIALDIQTPIGRMFSYYVNGALTDTDVPTGPVLPVLNRPAGTYVIEVEDQLSGCATTLTRGISDITLTVTAAAQTPTCDPVALDIQTNVSNFTGATYTITGVASGAHGPFPFFTANFSSVAVPVPDNYTIQINAQGCVATFDLDVVSDPQTIVSFAPSTVCPTQLTALPAGAVSYDWSASDIGSITSALNIQTVTLDVSVPRTWNLSVTVDDGVNCPGTATTTVSVGPAITVSITQSDACEDLVTLTASPAGPFTYSWTDPGGNPIVGGRQIVVATSGLYGVRVQNTLTGCFATATLNVFVAGDLQLGMTTTIPCQGSTFILTGTTTIPGTNFQWAVNGTNIPGAILPTLPRTTGGIYRLTGTLPGCTEFIEQEIRLFPVTPGSLPSRALICNKPENPDCILDPASCLLTLDAGPNFTSYLWSTGETTRTIIIATPDTYIVNLVNSYGCESTDQTEVVEECTPIIKAPTAFRPGSSIAENSSFYVFTYFVSDIQLFIYNRWGELVYQANGFDANEPTQSKHWNGGYNNDASKQLPGGTYTYVVKYKSEYRDNGPQQELRGGVVLLR